MFQNQPSKLTTPLYRPDIDGLRAIAVLSVVVFHAFPTLMKGGFIGVDIFFVISGFLISSIIFDNLKRGTFSFSEFYSRRIKRIFPALMLVLVYCLIFGWLALSSEEYMQLSKHAFFGTVFASNIIFLRESSNYFDNAPDTKPLLHLWSLGIEEQFYIVWPLLLYLAWKFRQDSAKCAQDSAKFALKVTIAITAISFLINILLLRRHATATFYLPVTRIWELSIGSLLAYGTLLKHTKPQWRVQLPGLRLSSAAVANVSSAIGAFLLCVAFLTINKQRAFPGWWGLLPTAGACLIIYAGPTAWINQNLLSRKALVWIGLISYPLYLWHWPLLVFANIIDGASPQVPIRVAIVLAAILLAWLTTIFVEKPIRFRSKSNVTVAPLIFGISAISVASLGIFSLNGLPSRSEAISALSKQQAELLPPPELVRSVLCGPKQYGDGIPTCVYLAKDSPPTVALIGDSHAEHHFFGLSSYYKQFGDNVVFIQVERLFKNVPCETYGNVWNYVINTNSIKTVIISPYHAIYIGNQFGDDLDSRIGNQNRYKKCFQDSVKRLSDSGKESIYVLDVPQLDFDIKACIARPIQLTKGALKQPCAIPRGQFDQRISEYTASVHEILRPIPKVKIFTPADSLCDEKYCWGIKEGKLLYKDNNHLSYEGSMYFSNRFSPK